jgi:hypothetical protein
MRPQFPSRSLLGAFLKLGSRTCNGGGCGAGAGGWRELEVWSVKRAGAGVLRSVVGATGMALNLPVVQWVAVCFVNSNLHWEGV